MAHGIKTDTHHGSSRDRHRRSQRGCARRRPVFYLGDNVKAGGYRHCSSRSRRTAALAGFFDFSHVFDGPLRYGASTRFETMPSSAIRQT
jgi:hypothetical protein